MCHYWPLPLAGSSKEKGEDGADRMVSVNRLEWDLDLGSKGSAVRGRGGSIPDVAAGSIAEGHVLPSTGKVELNLHVPGGGDMRPGFSKGAPHGMRVRMLGWFKGDGCIVGRFEAESRDKPLSESLLRGASVGPGSELEGLGAPLIVALRGSDYTPMRGSAPFLGTFTLVPTDGTVQSAVDLSSVDPEEAQVGLPARKQRAGGPRRGGAASGSGGSAAAGGAGSGSAAGKSAKASTGVP